MMKKKREKKKKNQNTNGNDDERILILIDTYFSQYIKDKVRGKNCLNTDPMQ